MPEIDIYLPEFHDDQGKLAALTIDARGGEWEQNSGGKRKAVRCGRRWGKTTFGVGWLGDGACLGEPCGLFAPDYKKVAETYQEIYAALKPIIINASKVDGVIRVRGGGRIDFWTLNDENAGRSRKYKRVFIDEAGFTAPNMMDVWKRAIKPTLLDLNGDCIAASNTNGNDAENFLWRLCNQPEHGFIEYHAPSWSNPLLPLREPGENDVEWAIRRDQTFADLKAREHPLVWLQEYESEFVDWSGVGFFDLEKLLWEGQPVDYPTDCDSVYAVIDTATKTGSNNDATGVTYFARSKHGIYPLIVLDWDAVQIEGALLETWLPTVLQNLEALAAKCRARFGSLGCFIEDAASGQILLQQARLRGLAAMALPQTLTSMGKDERAISVSGYVYQGKVKISREAYTKNTTLKNVNRNHFVSQVTGFHIGDKDAAKRADDLLDTFTYGIAIGLGNNEGF